MIKRLILLASACFFVFAPAVHVFGVGEAAKAVDTKEMRSDSDINSAVEHAIAADKDLSKFVVIATTTNGVVILSGTVDDAKTKAAFETKAKAVPGVKSITNNIEVKK